MKGSWLFSNDVDRKRMLELDQRLRPIRRLVFAILTTSLVACAPWLGWWTVLPVIVAAFVFRVAERFIDGAERPEYGLFAAWALSEVIIAASVVISGGPTLPTMSWLAIPLLTVGARFSERGIYIGTAFTAILMLGIAVSDSAAVLDSPPIFIAPLTLLLVVALFQTVLMRSEEKYRSAAVIDPLTGLLNRAALSSRISELEQQAAISRQPVAVLVGDLDHFKLINDTYGHAAGDDVLRDVAYQMRATVRAYDTVYRLGGEEFLVLLAGADINMAQARAEAIRAAIAAATPGGHHITLSLGVAASCQGQAFEYNTLFAEADAALYQAKQSGRNRVCVASRELIAA